jgi:ketosteroid isomerase-like protein
MRTISLLVLFLLATAAHVHAQSSGASLDAKTVAENKDLDRQLVEAHEQRDVNKVMNLFAKSPNTFFVSPNGAVSNGWEQVRNTYAQFLGGLESITAEIQHVEYFRTGNGVIGLGTVVFHRKDKGHPVRDLTVVWTDYRQKENGEWKYLFRHAHWPISGWPDQRKHAM